MQAITIQYLQTPEACQKEFKIDVGRTMMHECATSLFLTRLLSRKKIISKHPHRLRPVTCRATLCRCLREKHDCQSIVLSI